MGTKKTLDWHVTGEWVTSYARAKYTDNGDMQPALYFLTKCLPGMPEDIAKQIITGSKKLTGTDELYLADDDAIIEPPKWIKPGNIAEYLCGWISPEGKVYGLRTYSEQQDHELLAKGIVERGEVEANPMHEYNAIENAGYIKFSPLKAYAYAKPGQITEAQREQVLKFIQAHGYTTFQLGAKALGIENVAKIRQMDLLQFAKRLMI